MIFLILILALMLRIIYLRESLWLDEAINVLSAKNLGFWDFVTKYPIGDFHPPGYFAILWVWSHLFGYSEAAVRSPSIIFGIISVWITYLIGKNMFNKRIGIISSLFLATNPLHIYYSQEARMYAFATFAVVLSVLFLIRILREDDDLLKVGYILSLILVFYSDYVAYFAIPAQFVYVLIFKRSHILKVVFLMINGFIFLIPWLFIFPQQLLSGSVAAKQIIGWASVVGGSSVKDLALVFIKPFVGRVSLLNPFQFEVDKGIYYLLEGFLIVLNGFLFLNILRKIKNETVFLLFWIILPTGLAFIISFYIPVLSYFRLLFIVPGICLLLALSIDNLSQNLKPFFIVITILISVTFISLYFINPKYHREDWREATKLINDLAEKENGIILFENNSLFSPYLYYSHDKSWAISGLKKIPSGSELDLALIEPILETKKTVFLFEYLFEITDPKRLLQDKLKKTGYEKIFTYNFNNVGFVHRYSRI